MCAHNGSKIIIPLIDTPLMINSLQKNTNHYFGDVDFYVFKTYIVNSVVPIFTVRRLLILHIPVNQRLNLTYPL